MNFDQIIDRSGYPTFKLNKAQLTEHFGSDEVLPFWIADMDFQSPGALIAALTARAQHGIYGYEYKTADYFNAITGWYRRRHGWTLDSRQLAAVPGVLSAIAILIDQHSNKGDGVIIQPPVFFEFRSVIRSNHRRIVKNPLKLVDGKYQMDFDDLERKAAEPENKIMIVCNPHNPVGRVWTREELSQVGEICRRHNVLVISDEIHGDIVYPPHRYTPFVSLADELVQGAVSCLSPAKTFNIAGMVDAMAAIPNEDYRQQVRDFAHRYQINKTNVFALAAIETVYMRGDDWLDALLDYLQSNVNFLHTYFRENLPQVKLVEPEGTFLAWLDFTALGLDAKALEKFLAQKAKIAVSPGYWFGREGAGYARMNIATPRSVLQAAVSQLTASSINLC